MRLVAILAGALALAMPAAAQPSGLDAVFASYTPATPGCALGVQERDKPPVFRGYGSADLEHAVPITPDTVFEAGSVSKQFTAAAILRLVEDGKLSLSDDIRKFLPEMPDYGRPITVDMLLNHTSGLRDWGEVMDLAGWPRTSRVYTPSEVLQIATRQKALNYTPGEAYSYTNTGYNLAAWIVLRVTGQTLAQFTKARLFEPLGMTHTSWRDDFRRVVPGRAVAYAAIDDGGFIQEMPFENTYGHGALLTTVGDLLTWNDALTAGRLGARVSARMQEQAVLTGGRRIAYARGLVVQQWQAQDEVAHSGATAGYRAWLARFPKPGLSVALLCNRGDANRVNLGRRVAANFMPMPQVQPARAAIAPEDLARLPGVYVDERTGGVMRVAVEDGGLRLRGGGRFTPVAQGHFQGGGFDFAFRPDGADRRAPDGETVSYRRVEPVVPTAAELQSIAGAYASSEAGGELVVEVEAGRLVVAPADRPSQPYRAFPLHKDAFSGDGHLIRVIRGPGGRVTALRFTGPRVYALDFRRVETPKRP